MRFPPAIIQLRRAQLVLMLAVLVPTVLLIAVGILLLAAGSTSEMIFAGVLVLAFTSACVTGYILVSIFVGKGASLARVQNDFFSSVSHELRTPLTSIHLLLEGLANDRITPAERTQATALLTREVQRLDQLLVRTLDLSRMQAGRHPFDMRPVAVVELAAEAIAAFDAATLKRPTPIAVDVEPGLVVVGDRATLVLALVNLLINAWKYSGEDKRITVRGYTTKRRIVIAVEDNGPGIDPIERADLFEGFVRGAAAADTGAPGVGLGLAIVRAVVRAHRGKVELESSRGHGATFRLLLRRPRPPAPVAAPTADPSPHPT